MTAQATQGRLPASSAPAVMLASALVLALTAAAVVIGAGVGARRGAWDFLSGLRAAEWAVWGAGASLVVALIGLAGHHQPRGAWGSLVCWRLR